jgi:hypothetical protein
VTEERELFMGQLHRMDLDDPEIVSKVNTEHKREREREEPKFRRRRWVKVM